MKATIYSILSAVILLPFVALGQLASANSISFQGALTGANGQPLANANYNLTFKFYTNATTPTALATSNVPNVPVTNGIASTPIPVDAAWFNGQTRYLGIAINGGTELSPRVLITAVPHALSAETLKQQVFVTTNGNTGIGTASPTEKLEVFDGNISLRRFDEYPTGDRYLRFSTRNQTGGQMQDWIIAASPYPGRYNVDQHICDLMIGNRLGNQPYETLLKIDKIGDISMTRLSENPVGGRMLQFRTRSNTGGSLQDWGVCAEVIPGRYNVDQNICDFWIGSRIDGGLWDKHLYMTKNGAIGLGTENPQARLDVNGTARMTVCQITSDRNAKDKFTPVCARDVLAKLDALPILTWVYTNAPGIRHIGPVAQDFYAAFGFGDDDKHIATVDADGVALAAIQGLHQLVQEKDAKIQNLEKRLEALELKLESRFAANERP